jgi:hypothetical protein
MENTINDLFGFSDICESEAFIKGEGTTCMGCVRDGWCADGAKDTSPTYPCGNEFLPVHNGQSNSSSGGSGSSGK